MLDQYRAHAELCNRFAEKCREADVRFGYHNHEFEFEELEGRRPMDLLLAESSIRPEVTTNQARWRPADSVVGSAKRLEEATGWAPTTPLRETLRSLLDDWRERIAAA